MSIGWVAGASRARAMTTRRVGREGARALAAGPSLDAAVRTLAHGPYAGTVHEGATLADAQRGAVATALWNCRVLAGWVPRDGVAVLRVLAGTVEAINVVDHVRRLAGATTPPALHLGALSTSWPRVAATTTADGVRQALTASPWGDPGGTTAAEIDAALRVSLADRVLAAAPDAGPWAAGAVALLVAREAAHGRRPGPGARQPVARVLGRPALHAGSVEELAAVVPSSARWALAGVTGPEDLWRAEARWWSRVDDDGSRLVRRTTAGPAVLLGTVAMLAADAWRVRAALEVADRGPTALGVLDEVA
ncbi:hypothetical protein [uncultured Cellulomonas sp.]|uniref:hypothetical protein n=1 Tax=uncultured Cellulomonas sp. TaxID=189682 RepID=UPI00263938D7|nr:hypothetical protein [uncultured Cellulomonas sp.]